LYTLATWKSRSAAQEHNTIYAINTDILTMIYAFSGSGLPEKSVQDHQVDIADGHCDEHEGEANLQKPKSHV
jgi:hypothetical protein